MATLHIEHEIVDFDLWRAAFDRFEPARREHGVRTFRLQRPVDDPRSIVLQLDFATTEQAQGFLHFLEMKVWASPESSPALVGTPRTRILELVATEQGSLPA